MRQFAGFSADHTISELNLVLYKLYTLNIDLACIQCQPHCQSDWARVAVRIANSSLTLSLRFSWSAIANHKNGLNFNPLRTLIVDIVSISWLEAILTGANKHQHVCSPFQIACCLNSETLNRESLKPNFNLNLSLSTSLLNRLKLRFFEGLLLGNSQSFRPT